MKGLQKMQAKSNGKAEAREMDNLTMPNYNGMQLVKI